MYIIKLGTAKVTTSSESGQVEAVIAILQKGDWFGEIGLLANMTYDDWLRDKVVYGTPDADRRVRAQQRQG